MRITTATLIIKVISIVRNRKVLKKFPSEDLTMVMKTTKMMIITLICWRINAYWNHLLSNTFYVFAFFLPLTVLLLLRIEELAVELEPRPDLEDLFLAYFRLALL